MELTSLIPTFGSALWTIAAFIVALSVIVAVHEFGHYIVGRWSGIGAEVFSIGFGPVLWSRMDRRGTRWQIAALPLGGYVKFLGDADAASARPDNDALAGMDNDEARRTMYGAPLWARAATVAAGPVFNFALSIIVFAAVMMFRGVVADPLTVDEIRAMPGEVGLEAGDVIEAIDGRQIPPFNDFSAFVGGLPGEAALTYTVLRDGRSFEVSAPHPYPPIVAGVSPDSGASDAGMKAGDVILSVDNTQVTTFDQLRALVGGSDGRVVTLGLWRNGDRLDVVVTPRRVDLPVDGGFETRWLVGLTGGLFFDPMTQTPSLLDALQGGVRQTGYIIESSLSGVYHMAVGAISSCNLSGPLGIAQTSGAAASQGGLSFLWFIAVLSTAVGLLNLFPVPVLDGGHLVFYAYEAVVGRPPSDTTMRILMGVGLALLLGLMAFSLTNDLFCP